MRPAQLTPENAARCTARWACTTSFNEAGAINAGKRTTGWFRRSPRLGFNEAGAINAGKPEKGDTLNVRVKKLQ